MAGSGKVVPEGGQYEWDIGRGYVPPSHGGGIPPGWFSAPGEEMPDSPPPPVWKPEPPITPAMEKHAAEYMEQADAPEVKEGFGDMVGRMVAESIAARQPAAELPTERVNITNGTAAFMGYDVKLTEDGLESIKIILAAEVCLQLEMERERVLNAVQQQRVPTASGGDGTNVPEVPNPPQSVEQGPSSGSVEVLRMWEPGADWTPSHVLVVPGTQAGETRTDAEPRLSVPGEDDRGVSQPSELLQRDGQKPAHAAEDRRAPKRRSNQPRKRVRRRQRAAAVDVP